MAQDDKNAQAEASELTQLLCCPHCDGTAKEEQTRGSFGGYGFTRIYCQDCTANASKKDWQKRINQASII